MIAGAIGFQAQAEVKDVRRFAALLTAIGAAFMVRCALAQRTEIDALRADVLVRIATVLYRRRPLAAGYALARAVRLHPPAFARVAHVNLRLSMRWTPDRHVVSQKSSLRRASWKQAQQRTDHRTQRVSRASSSASTKTTSASSFSAFLTRPALRHSCSTSLMILSVILYIQRYQM